MSAHEILYAKYRARRNKVHIGASPAFYLSRSGQDFSPADILAALPCAARLGLSALQLELWKASGLEGWTPGAVSELRERFADTGLVPSQFVAHFALDDFRSAESLAHPRHDEDFKRCVHLAAEFTDCPIVTLPIPAFSVPGGVTQTAFADARAFLAELLGRRLEVASAAGKRLALEILPASIIGGTEGFVRLRAEAGLGNLAYNFDVGHAWARKECLDLVPALLGTALAGTHLCDNRGHENLKYRPGLGSVDWGALLAALEASGYAGSLDLEILCGPDEVEDEYAAGLAYLTSLRAGQEPGSTLRQGRNRATH